jgi:phage tail sheath protein FI
MAELTFKSPGVSTREIDLSGPTKAKPKGVPAGVIGTSLKGRAFVPIIFPTYADFVAEFGTTDGEKFGPLAIHEWMKNAKAGVFLKVLGAGDGRKRTSSGDNLGKVTNSGFVVGGAQVQANGTVKDNPYASAGQEAAVAASLANAINVTGVANDHTFTLTSPTVMGGDGVTYTFKFVHGLNEVNAGSSGNIYYISRHSDAGGTSALTTAQRATALANAINGAASPYAAFSDGNVTSVNSTDLKITADASAGDGTIDLSFSDLTLAAKGNGHANVLAATNGFAGTKILEDAFSGGEAGHTGHLGRTYFLGAFMAQAKANQDGTTTELSTIFSDAGIADTNTQAHPIIRGVLMAPSGVLLSLSSTYAADNDIRLSVPPAEEFSGSLNDGDAGQSIGSVNITNDDNQFVMLLNGFSNTKVFANALTASFNPDSPMYFAKIFNTDPTLTEKRGHLLYTHYDVHPSHADVTGSALVTAGTEITNPSSKTLLDCAFLFTGSAGRNTATAKSTSVAGIPNFENFEDRYRAPFTPHIISQKFGAKNRNLFKVYALDDGAYANSLFKITIENIQTANNTNKPYGTFDLLVRDFKDNDNNPIVLETFRKLSLNPSSDRYVARVIGNQNIYFDFDQNPEAQKIVVDGSHPNKSSYIRIEVDNAVLQKEIDPSAIPVGFRGHWHLVTSGSGILEGLATQESGNSGISLDNIQRTVQMPTPFRENVAVNTGDKKRVNSSLTWGVQFEVKDSATEPNKNDLIRSDMVSHTKYFPRFQESWQNVVVGDNAGAGDLDGTVLDADRFNNNLFSLERIQVVTGSTDKPVFSEWAAAVYRRNGKKGTLTSLEGATHSADDTRFLDASKDFNHQPSKEFLKFTLHLHGGFDGVNVFNEDQAKLTNAAAKREFDDATNQGGVLSGPTINTYRRAVDILKEKSNTDIQLLAIPGMRHKSITDYAIQATEERFDALYIMDIETRDEINTVITGSGARVHVRNTVSSFENRNLDSSFAAAYFPNVIMTDPKTATNIDSPPSVAVLGAFSLNDSMAHPWYAPAGFSRGSLKSVQETMVKLSRKNMDALYDADINPLNEFGHTPGVVVFGQKTLKAAQSSLDRVNVRRLLIDIRRRVKKIGEKVLFEPNRVDTLARFSGAVGPVLQRIQQQQGLDRFKVQIDTTTTTQHDIENNTIRGKIILQPTKAVEFISLDFVVTNAGTEI